MAGKTIQIYADTRGIGKCNGPDCGARILWATVCGTGNKMPFSDVELVALKTEHERETGRLIETVDIDSNHWATCPNSKSFGRNNEHRVPSVAGRHKCYVVYCDAEIPASYLMCPKHWAKVKPVIQREVWKWYRAKDAAFGEQRAQAVAKYREAIELARRTVETDERGMFGGSDVD